MREFVFSDSICVSCQGWPKPYGLLSGFVWTWTSVITIASAADDGVGGGRQLRRWKSRASSGAASTAGTTKKRIRNGVPHVDERDQHEEERAARRRARRAACRRGGARTPRP